MAHRVYGSVGGVRVRERRRRARAHRRRRGRRRENAHGRTPLLAAALGGHREIALALVAAGANIDAADDEGETPLYAAAFENHPTTVAALVAAGADVDGGEPETKPPETKPVLSTREDSRRTGTTLKKNGETRKTTPRRETFHHAKRVSSVSRPKKKKRRLRNASQGVIRRWWVRAGAATPRRSRPCSRTGPGAGRTRARDERRAHGARGVVLRAASTRARACCWQRAPRWTMRTRTGARRCGPPRAPATPPPCACASSAGATSTGRTRVAKPLRGRGRRDVHASVRGGVAGGARRRARASGRRRGPTRRRRRGPRAAQPRRPGQRGHTPRTRGASARCCWTRSRRWRRARKPPPGTRAGARRRTARASRAGARDARAARLERADAQARVAAAWVEKREGRAREPPRFRRKTTSRTMTSETPKTPKRPIRRLMTRRLVSTRASIVARARRAGRAARRARAGRVPRRLARARGTPSGGARSRSGPRTSPARTPRRRPKALRRTRRV